MCQDNNGMQNVSSDCKIHITRSGKFKGSKLRITRWIVKDTRLCKSVWAYVTFMWGLKDVCVGLDNVNAGLDDVCVRER